MKRLHPEELYKNNSYKGFRPRQVRAMAEHYGFIQSNEGKDGKHAKFTHRDYHDLTFNLQEGSGEVMQMYVQDAVDCCREVKRRNALRKEPVFAPIPEWVWKALPQGHCSAKPDNSAEYEMDDAEHHRYLVRMRENKLVVRSLDYPQEQFSASYTVRDGSANIPGLRMMFDSIEAKVGAHQHGVVEQFENDLWRLEHNHGYGVRLEDDRIYLTHPAYHEKVSLLMPARARAISEETAETVHALLEQSRGHCYEQMAFLDELNQQGWRVTHHPANGSAAALRLIGPKGEFVEVPTYGLHAVFDQALVSKAMESVKPTVQLGDLSVAGQQALVKPDAALQGPATNQGVIGTGAMRGRTGGN